MQVEIRPIERETWHGKKGSESFKRDITLQPLVDGNRRTYAVGLSQEELKGFEEKMGVNLSLQYNQEKNHEFWDSRQAVIKLKNRTEFYDTTIPLKALQVKMLKACPYVANSQREYEEGLWPEATHYIHNEAEEMEVIASKLALRNKAIRDVTSLTLDQKAQIVLLLSGKVVKGRSQDLIEVELNRIIEDKPKDVLYYIERDKEINSVEALVLEAINKSILIKKGHRIMYFDADLGTSTEEVAKYLMDPANQELKIRIMQASE